MHPRHTSRIVAISAAYDLFVTAPFATPWTARFVFDRLAALHAQLGLPGSPPEADGLTLLFANLMGSVVVVWSVVRLRDPSLRLGAADTVARLLLSAWMAAALARGVTPLVGLFLALELGRALLQGVAITRPMHSKLATLAP